jgi:hypothetical protein
MLGSAQRKLQNWGRQHLRVLPTTPNTDGGSNNADNKRAFRKFHTLQLEVSGSKGWQTWSDNLLHTMFCTLHHIRGRT